MANETLPTLVNCPACDSGLVLLPHTLFTSAVDPAELDLGDIVDTQTMRRVASYALVNADGDYTCPRCRKTQTFGHSVGTRSARNGYADERT
jgi:hypothetical protein